MKKWQLNLLAAGIAMLGLQLISDDVDRYFYAKPVLPPERQVQIVSDNATIKSGASEKPEPAEASPKPQTGQIEPGGEGGKATDLWSLEELNAMDAKALEAINGIGPVLAERIVAYRREKGAFKALKDLGEVKGIGPKTLEKILAQFK